MNLATKRPIAGLIRMNLLLWHHRNHQARCLLLDPSDKSISSPTNDSFKTPILYPSAGFTAQMNLQQFDLVQFHWSISVCPRWLGMYKLIFVDFYFLICQWIRRRIYWIWSWIECRYFILMFLHLHRFGYGALNIRIEIPVCHLLVIFKTFW